MKWRFGLRKQAKTEDSGAAEIGRATENTEAVEISGAAEATQAICQDPVISIPITVSPQPVQCNSAQVSQDGSQRECPVVIAVDDEPIILNGNVKVLSQTLTHADIHGFRTAEDALEFAQTQQVDLAFLDIELQTSSGLILAKDLQEINPKTNVIFVSSYSQYMDEAKGVESSSFLNKPLKQEKVLQSLTCLLHPIAGLV